MWHKIALLICVIILCGSCRQSNPGTADAPETAPSRPIRTIRMQKKVFIHQKFKKPTPGDWAYHYKERGQPYHEYIQINPVRVTDTRNTLYILPVGEFGPTEKKLLEDCCAYLNAYFGLNVRVHHPYAQEQIPDSARRFRREDDIVWEQLLTKHLMHEVLLPQLPEDAMAYMAITPLDLYPREDWNFVFGQASTKKRIGVSSFYRYTAENWTTDQKSYQKALSRLMKTITHEIGHMFSMMHCIYYTCNMNGSNSLEESDRKPLHLCPICAAKLSWNLQEPLKTRYQRLATFFEGMDMVQEKAFCDNSIAFLDSLTKQWVPPIKAERLREVFIEIHDRQIRTD